MSDRSMYCPEVDCGGHNCKCRIEIDKIEWCVVCGKHKDVIDKYGCFEIAKPKGCLIEDKIIDVTNLSI